MPHTRSSLSDLGRVSRAWRTNSARGLSKVRPANVSDHRYQSFIDPCLATLRPSVPAGDEWVHEIKYDGYRTQAHVRGGSVHMYTRRGHDWTATFRAVAD